ncbi:MAG TPA: chemotaxis protein CheX [Bacillota bacterium]|nr:chemotaxis protein CheX [Bacillota bacterium]
MKAEYVNTFIRASISVIEELCGKQASLGKVHLRDSPIFANQVVIMIGMVGRMKGQVYFELSADMAKSIVSLMMGGLEVHDLDEISKSAISEMGNMIMGSTGILFAQSNIAIEITPPSLLTGHRIEISNNIPTIVIPLEIEELGTFSISICAEELL